MNPISSETAKPTGQSPFKSCDFSSLFFGSSVSAFGGQFTLVAWPWLVLKRTGDPAARANAAVVGSPQATSIA